MKQDYIAELNDPIAQWSPATAAGHDSWMGFFVYFEMAVALPIVLFTVYRLGFKRQGTSGAHELALMVYAFEAAFTTAVCMHDVFYWDNSVYTAAMKNKLLYQMYLPWLVVRESCLPRQIHRSQLIVQPPSSSSTWPAGSSPASAWLIQRWQRRRSSSEIAGKRRRETSRGEAKNLKQKQNTIYRTIVARTQR